MVEPHHVGAVGDRRDKGVQHPGSGIADFGEPGDRLGPRCGGLGVLRRRVDGRACCAGRVAERGQVDRQLVVEIIDAAGLGVVDGRGERCDRRIQALGQFRTDQPADPSHRHTQRGRRQFAGGHRGDTVSQLVRLIDDEKFVFGQDAGFGDGVDGQQGVIGDDHIGLSGLGAGLLGEAVRAVRAARHAEAFPRGDAHLGPGPVRHTGAYVVAVPGLGLRRPGGQALHVATERTRCGPEELFLGSVGILIDRAAVNLVEAQVVSAAFE